MLFAAEFISNWSKQNQLIISFERHVSYAIISRKSPWKATDLSQFFKTIYSFLYRKDSFWTSIPINDGINDVTSAFKLKTTFENRSILLFHKVHFVLFPKNNYNIYLSIVKLAVELAVRCIRTNGSTKGEIQSSQSKSAGPKSN